MILQDSLYKITSSHDKSFHLELIPDCLVYRAHFPEQPITPGVCIIQIATELLRKLMQRELELTTVVNAKFLSVIDPLQTSSVTYEFNKLVVDDEHKTLKVSVVVKNSETIFTKLSLVYKEQ